MMSPRVSTPATKLWSMAGSSFSSCRINERRVAAKRIAAANGLDHESDRGLVIAPALSRGAHGAGADRRRVVGLRAPADGCVSRSLAAHGRDHHPMAGTCRRGGGTADHRARRTRNERGAANDGEAFDFALWFISSHPHIS